MIALQPFPHILISISDALFWGHDVCKQSVLWLNNGGEILFSMTFFPLAKTSTQTFLSLPPWEDFVFCFDCCKKKKFNLRCRLLLESHILEMPFNNLVTLVKSALQRGIDRHSTWNAVTAFTEYIVTVWWPAITSVTTTEKHKHQLYTC